MAALEHNKFRFPSLSAEEAVANCNSMFGSQVKLTLDDLLHPQVSCFLSHVTAFCFCAGRIRKRTEKSVLGRCFGRS